MAYKSRYDSLERDALNALFDLVSIPNRNLDQFFLNQSSISNIVSIGGCPSSGTTLTADLLDSIDGFLCDPELGFFSIQESYEAWDILKQDLLLTNYKSVCGYAKPRPFFNLKYLDLLGIPKHYLWYLMYHSSSLYEFVRTYALFRAHARERKITVYAEKTPANICFAQRFLDSIPHSFFVYVVRHPVSTINSLMRRGYSFKDATWIWLSQNSYAISLLNSPQCFVIKYEDLLHSPFHTISKVAEVISGVQYNPENTRISYEKNSFRRSLPRPQSWNFNSNNWRVLPPSQSRISFSKSLLEWLHNVSIAATEYTVSVSMVEICSILNYSLDSKDFTFNDADYLEYDSLKSKKKLYLADQESLFS